MNEKKKQAKPIKLETEKIHDRYETMEMYWNLNDYQTMDSALVKINRAYDYGNSFGEDEKIVPVALTLDELALVMTACEIYQDGQRDELLGNFNVDMYRRES